ncbi:MAG: phenylalanine--tRNA ligase subunit alpha [Alphaproteobacteria bacterium]|nr:phenylalanine--tRNA ligase subunit alpha [Alphaproteobacteria bacterium]
MTDATLKHPLYSEWQPKVGNCQDLQSLEEIRIHLLGKTGLITNELKTLGQLAPEDRKAKGSEINALRDSLAELINHQKDELQKKVLELRLQDETVDITLPPRFEKTGKLHLLTQVISDIQSYFSDLGFQLVEGPEMDDEHHNFDALNIPSHHPARQSHDTFYLKGHPSHLLRTHTSTAQIRTLEKQKPPLRIISIGRVYRSDALDATHTPMFHQLEGLVLEPNINMGHLRGCLIDFCKYFFGVDEVKSRFRPSFFPFTEPSAELDINCSREKGQLKIGIGDSWLELLGCGMVHPNVLKNCGIDPDEFQGFAFGAGIERFAMLKYGLPDIRALYDSDERWLNHYGTRY